MLSSKLSFFLAFFFWAMTLEAAPAMHHHRHGSRHLQSLHAERAALRLRTRSHSHSHHEALQIMLEEPQQPSESLPALAAPDQEPHGHSVERLAYISTASLICPWLLPIHQPRSNQFALGSTPQPTDTIFVPLSFPLFPPLTVVQTTESAVPQPILRSRELYFDQSRARSLAHSRPTHPGPVLRAIFVPIPPVMPSPRRVRLLILATIGTFIFILFYTSGFDSHHDAETSTGQEFIKKTQNAMSANEMPAPIVDFATGEKAGQSHNDKDGDGDIDEEDKKMANEMQQRLKAAEAEAKGKANEKGGLRPDPPKKVVGVGSSAEGQNKDKIVKPAAGEQGDAAAAAAAPNAAAAADKKPETETRSKVELEARAELDSILKKSPVIIFSKTYCPYSKKAKSILIEKYSITPEPYIVELDVHPQGPALQDQLLETTGRRTVPNIMVNGVSLGGADDITEMDHAGNLVGKIVDLGNKRVEMTARSK
ncbi:unnamed protein product [Fusarium equiseti]|uniref:Glutaredoxin domain-containing protein n=1 Tax=Fusarium equiseti TaxID=61235 RepID=A0A8J2IGW5_FUSEQ|nr:unnamed protein product [Fusarium equiseti]